MQQQGISNHSKSIHKIVSNKLINSIARTQITPKHLNMKLATTTKHYQIWAC